jgi:hypothetical protein
LSGWHSRNCPRGRIRTWWPSVRTLPVLSGTPLLVGLHAAGQPSRSLGEGWYPRSDLHRHCARFKCAVSALDYVGCWRRATNWCRVRDLASQARHKMDAPKRTFRYRELWSTPNLSVLSGAPLVVGPTRQKMVLPAGISPATWRFEAARSDSLSYGSYQRRANKWGRRGDSHSRGADLPGSLRNCCCRC